MCQSLGVLIIIFFCFSMWIQASLILYSCSETKMEIVIFIYMDSKKSFPFLSR